MTRRLITVVALVVVALAGTPTGHAAAAAYPCITFPTGHMQFNPCARLDPSQVQYRRGCHRSVGGVRVVC